VVPGWQTARAGSRDGDDRRGAPVCAAV